MFHSTICLAPGLKDSQHCRYSAHIVETNETVAIKKACKGLYGANSASAQLCTFLVVFQCFLVWIMTKHKHYINVSRLRHSNVLSLDSRSLPLTAIADISGEVQVFVDRRYRNRELQVWREMHHPNIVTLKAGALIF